MTTIFRLILIFVLGIFNGQIWASVPTTTGQTYGYDVSEYFCIDQNNDSKTQKLNYDTSRYFYIGGNTESEGQKSAYDSRQNLSKLVEHLQTEPTDAKPRIE